ncbi:uncharacterized protein [Haliotis asinina]|uniref:uncharacterized protein n=1 Tax=Haliotis asinina TaxID=109174 RepID=UPI003531A17F
MFGGTWAVVAAALISCSSTYIHDQLEDAVDESLSNEYSKWLTDEVDIQRRAEEAVNLAEAAAAEEEYERIKYDMKKREGAESESSHGSAPLVPEEGTREKRSHGGVPMGRINRFCDDAVHKLAMDWDPADDANRKDYICNSEVLQPEHQNFYVHCEHPHKPIHRCMSTPLHKYSDPPTSGNHRPLWAKYGEYTFLPWQRWLHNLEHGAVAFLYHKCADPVQVNKTRQMLTKCLRKHIITPYPLPEDKPFALLSWGCYLPLTHFDEKTVFRFIRTHALHGRENSVTLDGQYSLMLTAPAKQVSDNADSDICPASNFPELRAEAARELARKQLLLGQIKPKHPLSATIHKSQRHKKSLEPSTNMKKKRSTDFVASGQKLEEGNSSGKEERMLEKREADWPREEPSQIENEALLLEGSEREAKVARLERGLEEVKRLFRSNVEPFLNSEN